MHQLLKAENSLFQSQLDDMKALLKDSQATINNQEITINSLKTEKEVGQMFCSYDVCTRACLFKTDTGLCFPRTSHHC